MEGADTIIGDNHIAGSPVVFRHDKPHAVRQIGADADIIGIRRPLSRFRRILFMTPPPPFPVSCRSQVPDLIHQLIELLRFKDCRPSE